MRPAKPTGFIAYSGPSQLDGAPIVALVIPRSENAKTGDMVQTYILRADVDPIAALKSGADASICGDCRHRQGAGGACYVNVGHGPRAVYGAFKRGRYPRATGEELAELGRGRMVRLGAYGDPMAVPAQIWETLTLHAAGATGYSHQWRNGALMAPQWARIRALCMASVDSPSEARAARELGWRTFRIRTETDQFAPREFACPAAAESGKRKTCAECGACNGARGASDTRANPVIVVHGVRAARFAQMRI